MTVGALRIDFAIYEAQSLKDKRRLLKGFKDRLASRYNVSVAEVDHLDSWQRGTVGIAMVSNDAVHVHSCLDKIVDFARRQRGLSLIDYEKSLL
ncbi:MAG: DUF503 domain-containing protein [Phycisphaerae bacterium]|nr:DUF503 domain-containing protein [Phycisphaerae bacterium]